MSAVDKAAEVFRSMGVLQFELLADALLEIQRRLREPPACDRAHVKCAHCGEACPRDMRKHTCPVLHWQGVVGERAACGVVLHVEHARAAGDVQSVTCEACKTELRAGLGSYSAFRYDRPWGKIRDSVWTAPPEQTQGVTSDASDLIALCAVVMDEAESFARQRADIRDRNVDCNGAVLDVHAQRCRSLYQKLCATASHRELPGHGAA